MSPSASATAARAHSKVSLINISHRPEVTSLNLGKVGACVVGNPVVGITVGVSELSWAMSVGTKVGKAVGTCVGLQHRH